MSDRDVCNGIRLCRRLSDQSTRFRAASYGRFPEAHWTRDATKARRLCESIAERTAAEVLEQAAS